MSNKYLVLFTITVFITVSVFHVEAAEVIATRVNSEENKTRIVIVLDGPTNYQMQYTQGPGISIALLETGLSAVEKRVNVDDELVEAMTLKEIMGNIVDANISLKQNANFTIFPIESPDRIVIDITPIIAAGSSEFTALPIDDVAPPAGNLKMESGSSSIPEAKPETEADLKPDSMIGSVLTFKTRDYIIALLCFDLLLAAALIVMGIKLRRFVRASTRSSESIEKSQDFNNMVSELKQNIGNKSNFEVPKTPQPVKSQKAMRKEADGARTSSFQKRYEKVHELAQLGMDRLAISQKSNVPIGEVNLILDLSKNRSEAKPN